MPYHICFRQFSDLSDTPVLFDCVTLSVSCVHLVYYNIATVKLSIKKPCFLVLSKLLWGHTVFSLEKTVEVREIVKTALLGNGEDTFLRCREHSMCHGQAVIIEIMNKAGLHVFLKKFHKMGRTVVTQLSHLGNCNRLVIVFLDVLYDKFELLQDFFFGGSEHMALPIRSQKEEKLEQRTFQRKLIASRPLFTESVHMTDY